MRWTLLCVAAAPVMVSMTEIYVLCECSGCIMHRGMSLVATTLYLHNKSLVCVEWIALFTNFKRF